ncbi:hypothetical protein RR46_06651 [Papilio xuthus]|uniref:Direct IAP-binding protein with low pI n=1 Tax=Papilio xuthus TaxID=66420 RepID=I4DPD2_PAPXU|nr:hypothetical protein RR46_06651 [Papilio xuthus]BAM19772.1 unknown unsecreted protein [Papilio xuthus]
MFKYRLFAVLRAIRRIPSNVFISQIRKYTPTTLGLLGTTVYCAENHDGFSNGLYDGSLEHEFLIRQATTVNVNAATQLLTVTLVAIQDTSERLRDALSKEICLVQQAMEWGEVTPPEHWDQLVAVRGTLCDLRHNLRTLYSYMDYAEKIATVAAEISYLSGNNAASDAICERIEQALRSCNIQKQLNQVLQEESLELQQKAIISSPQLEDKLVKDDAIDKDTPTIDDTIDKEKLIPDDAIDKDSDNKL